MQTVYTANWSDCFVAGARLFCINQQVDTTHALLTASWPKKSGLSVLTTLVENRATNCFVNFGVLYCAQPDSPPTSLSPAEQFSWSGSTDSKLSKLNMAAGSGWSDCFDDKNTLYCTNRTAVVYTATSIAWPTVAQDAAVLSLQQQGYSRLFVANGRLWGVKPSP